LPIVAPVGGQHEIGARAADSASRGGAVVGGRAATELDQQFVWNEFEIGAGRRLRGAAG
jgi:hypothetical protein